ncbi:MAG: ATP-binding protein [Candidatus Thorarchaeota archaeon]
MIDIKKHINKLERKPGKQTGYIRVMSKIVKDLSSGIYSSPANCIKEIINNSFDADATEVIVRAKPSLDIFSITDNGNGMSIEEFDEQFSVISKSFKRIGSQLTEKFKRPIIGKIGIGFIAVNEICDSLTIITKRKHDKGRIKAEINFKKFKDEDKDSIDEFYKKSSFNLYYEEVPGEKDENYTKIILTHLTADFKKMLLDKAVISEQLENKTFEEITQYLRKERMNSYEQLSDYWKIVMGVAQTVPVEYMQEGPIRLEKKDSIIENIKEKLKSYNFKVDFDGLILKKPTFFPTEDKFDIYGRDFVVHSFKKEIPIENTKLSFRGYFYSQHGGIFPKDDAGVLIRVKNVKVGDIDSGYLGYPFVTNQVFRHWNFCEIYIDDGLERAMNIDRNSFRVTDAHYRALKQFMHSYLDEVVFPYCLDGFYKAKKERKEKEKRKKHEKKIKNVLKFNFNQFGKKTNIEVKEDKTGDPVDIKPEEATVVIRPKTSVFKNYSKGEKEFLQEILVLFEAAYKKAKNKRDGVIKLKEYFLENLRNREK